MSADDTGRNPTRVLEKVTEADLDVRHATSVLPAQVERMRAVAERTTKEAHALRAEARKARIKSQPRLKALKAEAAAAKSSAPPPPVTYHEEMPPPPLVPKEAALFAEEETAELRPSDSVLEQLRRSRPPTPETNRADEDEVTRPYRLGFAFHK